MPHVATPEDGAPLLGVTPEPLLPPAEDEAGVVEEEDPVVEEDHGPEESSAPLEDPGPRLEDGGADDEDPPSDVLAGREELARLEERETALVATEDVARESLVAAPLELPVLVAAPHGWQGP